MTAYSRFSCRTYDHPGLSDQWRGVYRWLDSLSPEPQLGSAPDVEVFRTGTKEEQAAWLRNAIDRLRRCA